MDTQTGSDITDSNTDTVANQPPGHTLDQGIETASEVDPDSHPPTGLHDQDNQDDQSGRDGRGRGCGVFKALALCWLQPVRIAQQAVHMTLGKAFLIHLIAAVFLFCTIIFIVAFADSWPDISFRSLLNGFVINLDTLVREITRYPNEALIPIFFSILGIELFFLALALLISPWAAKDEPFRGSYKHSLKTTWLVTAQIPVLVFLASMTGGTFEMASQHASQTLWSSYPAYPTRPTIAAINQKTSPKWQTHQAEVAAYRTKIADLRSAWEAKQPWYITHSGVLLTTSIILCIIWFLSSLLRTAGVPREVIPIARPPTCEICGYNLTLMPMEGRCPECGAPVVESLGEASRGGTVWQQRSRYGLVRAWWLTTNQAIKRPAKIGRLLQTQSFGNDHRRFFVMHIPIIFLFAYMTTPILYMIDTQRNPMLELEVMTIAAPILGLVITTGTVGVVLFMALLVGGHFTRLEKRNLMPAAMQMSCYLSGYLFMWLVFAFATGLLGILLEKSGLWMILQHRTGMDREILATLFVLIPNLFWFLYAIKLVARGTAAARYANR